LCTLGPWIRVETKTLFSFLRKAKISKNSFTFLKISRNFISRKFLLSRKFLFCKTFLFPGWFLQKNTEKLQKFSFSPMFQIWIHIQLAPESGSAFRIDKILRKVAKIFANSFAKTFGESENYCKLFSRKKLFAKIFVSILLWISNYIFGNKLLKSVLLGKPTCTCPKGFYYCSGSCKLDINGLVGMCDGACPPNRYVFELGVN
jgi:hypothetical protein